MATLNFPPNPSIGDYYTIGLNTWVWDGYAWIKYSSSSQSPISINTGTQSTSTNTGALVIDGGIGVSGSINIGTTSTIAGAEILTTATWADFINLQTVTDSGNTTSNPIHITNTTETTGTGTGALIIDGGISVAKRVHAESVQIADSVFDSTEILVNNTNTVIVDSYSIDQFRSAKYLIQIDDGDGVSADFQTIEILLLVDNQATVYATEYAVLGSNGELGEFAAEVDISDNVNLYFTPYYVGVGNTMTIKLLRIGLEK